MFALKVLLGSCFLVSLTAFRVAARRDEMAWAYPMIEGSLEVKLPTIWTDEKQTWEEAERRERLEERRVEEKE